MSADYGPAIWIPTTHFVSNANVPRYIVVHGTGFSLAQTAADVAHDFATTNPNSTHYAVGRAGDVAQMVREADVAWGNGVITAGAAPWWSDDPNTYTISIEHVNDADNATPLTPAQAAASFALIGSICRRHGIPPRAADRAGGIAGHYQIDPVNRSRCPGNYPWQALWTYLNAQEWAMTPWTAPGAEAISEFARQTNGTYFHATCVEAAALMCLIAQKPAASIQPGAIGDYLERMVTIWQGYGTGVSAQGASSYLDAARWLRDQGMTVHDNVLGPNWWNTLQAGLAIDHNVYLVGVTNAQALPGDEAGVQNHGLCAYGIDANGNIICGDPDNDKANVNMPGSPIGLSRTYTHQDFINGQISSLTEVLPMSGVPAGWHDDGTTLTAPNGIAVVHGFRARVLAGWDPADFPLAPEQTRSPLEISNPALGGGSRQVFRWSTLEWTAARGVFVAWTGPELLAEEARAASGTADPKAAQDAAAVAQIKTIVAPL